MRLSVKETSSSHFEGALLCRAGEKPEDEHYENKPYLHHDRYP